MATFDELGLSEKTLAAVKQMGYTEATPVQEQAIPLVLAGNDVIAAAQTGTGKTAAFVLPVLDKLDHFQRGEGPHCLIITPTRELAQQIDDVAKTVGKKTGHWVLTVVGGLSYNPQINGLRRGVDVLVATPGRLLDLYERGVLDLSCVKTLVIDEADRMLDMGFWPDVSRILEDLPAERQTLLFSATIDESVMKTIGGEVKDPKFVEIAHKGTAAETVDQYVIPVSQSQKPDLLKHVLDTKGAERVIVFTRTKFRAESLADRLYRDGFSTEAIHGDRSQAQRQRALKAFKNGRVDVIVATDVLARGIDVSDVEYVVNYDVPMDPEDYIHRIGRTGRAGERGMAITFVTFDDINDLYAAEYLMKKVVPEMELDDFDFDDRRPELDPERDCTRRPRKGGKGRGRGGRGGRGGYGGRGGRGGYDRGGYGDRGGYRGGRDRYDRDDREFDRDRDRDRGGYRGDRPRHSGGRENFERTRRQEDYVEAKAERDAALTGVSTEQAAREAFPIKNREERRAERFQERGERGYRSASYRDRDRDDRRGGYGDRGGYGRDDRRGGYGERGYDRDDRRGGYGDRGGYGRDDRRGGYGRDDRRDGYGERGYGRGGYDRDDRRGGYGRDDRRGGYGDRGGYGRDDRRGGYGDRGGYGRDDRRGGYGERGDRGGRVSSRYAQGSYARNDVEKGSSDPHSHGDAPAADKGTNGGASASPAPTSEE
ncbi:MAG: DEAD/DEAH box helicase [Coriobacteriales bacterium]|jgi:ATP-dependent RNA helicase RhlE